MIRLGTRRGDNATMVKLELVEKPVSPKTSRDKASLDKTSTAKKKFKKKE